MVYSITTSNVRFTGTHIHVCTCTMHTQFSAKLTQSSTIIDCDIMYMYVYVTVMILNLVARGSTSTPDDTTVVLRKPMVTYKHGMPLYNTNMLK